MFKIPEDISQVHRYIEKLPRFQEFMTAKQTGSINYDIGYKTSLTYLQQFVTTNYSGLNIDTIIDSGITDVYKFLGKFVAFLQTKKLAKSSVKQYLNDIKSYLQYHDIDIIPYKFKKRVILPKIPQEDAQPIDANDIRTILNQCHNRRLKIDRFLEEKNRGNKIHLLLLDYRLGDMFGDSVARTIKQYNGT